MSATVRLPAIVATRVWPPGPLLRTILLMAIVVAATLPAGPAHAAVSANLVHFPTGQPYVTPSAIEDNGNVAANAIDGSTDTDWGAHRLRPR